MNERTLSNLNPVKIKIHTIGIQEAYVPGIKVGDVVKRGQFEFKSSALFHQQVKMDMQKEVTEDLLVKAALEDIIKNEKIKKVNIKKLIIVVFLAFSVALLNVSKVIIGAFQTTKDTAYLAVGHYLSDYFVYIQQIVQGMRGHWLVENPLDPYDRSKTFIAFGQYLLLGKLAKIFNWSPYFTYWLTVFVLSIIFSLLVFYLIKRLLPNEKFFLQISAWFLSLFATPFIKIIDINNHLKIVPYDYWYAPMSIFHRFGEVPHHLTSMIFIILVLLLTDRVISELNRHIDWSQLLKKTLIIVFLLVFLLTFAPFQVINLMSSFLIVGWIYFNLYLLKNNKQSVYKLIIFLGLILITVFPSAIYIKISLHSIDYFKRASLWEVAQQNYPKFWEFFAVTGPILIFIPFGIKSFFKSIFPLKFLFFFYTFVGYVYFYSPLATYFGSHNGRFVNPVVYTLFGVLTILGIKAVTGRLTKKPTLLTGVLAVFLGYFLIVTSVIYRSLPGVDLFSYLPKELFAGIKVLDQRPDKKIVLTSPMMTLGMIVPVVVDRKVYLGNSLSTPDFQNKTIIADQFYAGTMTDKQAKQLVIKNNIGYVILSLLETYRFGNYKFGTLEAYPFLKKIYENKAVKIFKVVDD